MKNNNLYRTRNRSKRKSRSAFTLIEVMIVLFILLSLAGVGIVTVLNTYENSKKKNAELYVKAMADACDFYRLSVGRYPSTEQGLNALLEAPQDLPDPSKWDGPYLKDSVQTHDPWGSPYQYAYPGTHSRDGCDVWSLGPDGVDGNEDDIGNWKK